MKTFIQIIQMLPALITAVKQVEEFVPSTGSGKEKLAFIIGIIQDTVEDAKSMIPTIEKVVSRLVILANSTGVFAKGQQ